jgi:hypothetical protein
MEEINVCIILVVCNTQKKPPYIGRRIILKLIFERERLAICELAECHFSVVATPALYSGGFWFISQRPPIMIEDFHGFPRSLKVNAGMVP